MSLENILSGPMVERIGWTLIHFLWQGAALAVMLSAELVLLRRSKANVRYIAACLTLALMVFVPCVTMFMVPVSESEFERAADISLTSSSFERGLAEVAEVSRPKSTEPISPKDVAAPVVSVGSSYSWRERTDAILEPVLPYVVLGWLVGVFGLSVWHLGGWTQLQRLRRKMVKQVGLPWQSRVKELGELLGIRRAVQLVESALVRVPTVVGWVKPVILLPASALTGLTGEELEAILAHELAHIKRFDYLVNMLQTAVEILGFYHPAVWWVSHKIRVERENCCDDLAVSVSGDRVRYAKALTLLEEIRGGHAGLAVAASGVSLLGRVRRLVGTGSRENKRCSWVPAVIALLLMVGLAVPTGVALSSRSGDKTDVEAEGISLSESEFTAVLSNGVTVELVGVCEHPSYGEQWWRPDGSALGYTPYEWTGKTVTSKTHPQQRELVFRLDNLRSDDVHVDFELDCCGGGAGIGHPLSNGKKLKDLWATEISTEENVDVIDARLGVAVGEWETIADWDGRGRASYSLGKGNVRFNNAIEKKGQTYLPVAHDIARKSVRLIAMGKSGKIIKPRQNVHSGRGELFSSTCVFDERLKKIEKFKFQMRPCEWVEFRDVSLKPGVKTHVEVVMQPVAAEISREAGVIAAERTEKKRVGEKTIKERIAAKLTNLEKQRVRIQSELRAAEIALEEVRTRWGLTDLEERSYPHTITLRLNDLELEQNKLLLELKEAQAEIENLDKKAKSPEGKANLKNARDKLAVLMSKFEELQKMRDESAAKKRDLDLARVQYKQRLAIRDERRQMLDSIKSQIEKLKIIYDDPDMSERPIVVAEQPSEGEKMREDRRLGREEIRAKLTNVEKQRTRVQRDLDVAERALGEVRNRWGFYDLEERSYPHPVTSRVIRLERQRDDCALEIAQLRAKINNLEEQADSPEGKASLKKAQGDLIVLISKLEELQKMRDEAAAKKRDLDLARVQYKQRASIRDERKRMLDSIKSQIEKLKILHDDPETPERAG